MIKRARIAVDCCGGTLRIICPLKTGFSSQSERAFKQYAEEVLILTQVGLVFLTTSVKCINFRCFRLGSCDCVEWA